LYGLISNSVYEQYQGRYAMVFNVTFNNK